MLPRQLLSIAHAVTPSEESTQRLLISVTLLDKIKVAVRLLDIFKRSFTLLFSTKYAQSDTLLDYA